jgi:Tol biopolymer transport system component
MGEVYQARDTRLDRTVAIKVLPASLADDPEFRARFEREAKSISALNHPHICTLYDIGEVDGAMYLVMEHLEGETLADRLQKGPLPVDQALALACQIANALDKAHRQGIIHRDLKPGNVFLVRSLGTSAAPHCKLLDFGLAKTGVPTAAGSFETRLATAPAPGSNPPRTARGTILGTFQYMAPEQIEGQETDARADIWAFGCVLYEMLTARRAFEGKSQASLIASILERQPTPIAELQPLTPPALGRIVRTCLEKNPDNRFHTAHDLWLQLEWVEEGGSAAGLPAPVVAGRRRRARGLVVAAVAASALLAAAAAWWLKPDPVMTPVVGRFTLALPDGQAFTRTGRRYIAISPDGTKIAYIANRQIYLRKLEEFEAQAIPGTSVNPGDLTFSPDGMSLAFIRSTTSDETLASATIARISIAGGTAVTLGSAATPSGLRWQNGRILYTNGAAIMSLPETGGSPTTLVEVSAETGGRLSQPSLLPDGRTLLYTRRPRAGGPGGDIVVQPLGAGQSRVLVAGGVDGRVAASGHLIWIHENVLFAQSLNLRTLETVGVPVSLVENVRLSVGTTAGQYAFSDTGTLILVQGRGGEPTSRLVWVDRAGREEAIGLPPENYRFPRISPDGTKIAVALGEDQGDIAVWDLARRTLARITSGADNDILPAWSADGKSIFFTSAPPSGTSDIYRRAADGTGARTRLTESNVWHLMQGLIPGSDRLLVRVAGQKASVAAVPIAGGKTATIFSDDLPPQLTAQVSPDGRWIAYQSREGSTRDEIHVRPFPDTNSGHWQISSEGGSVPMWSRSGRELFFRASAPARLMRVEVHPASASGPFTYGSPSVLFDLRRYRTGGPIGTPWDITPDDRRFVMAAPVHPETEQEDDAPIIRVVTGWFEELRSRVRPQ